MATNVGPADVRRLLRWIRASRRGARQPTQADDDEGGRVPLRLGSVWDAYADLSLEELSRVLVNTLDALPVDGRARDALVRFYGLVGPPERLTAVAPSLRRRDGTLGVSTRRAQMLIGDAIMALADALPARSRRPCGRTRFIDRPGHRPSVEELRTRASDRQWRTRIRSALLAARTGDRTAAVDGSAPPRQRQTLDLHVALAQLESDVFSTPPPRAHRGTTIEPWLRYRLRNCAWATVCAADPSLTGESTPSFEAPLPGEETSMSSPIDAYEERRLGPRRLASVQGPLGEELGQALACEPESPEAVVELLSVAEAAFCQGLSTTRELCGLARDGLVAHGLLADRNLFGRILALHATLASQASDPTALPAVRMLDHVLGPTDSLTLRTTFDLTAAWSSHGYTERVVALLMDRLRQLDALPPSPQRDFFRAFCGVRLAGTVVEQGIKIAPRTVDRVCRLVDQILGEDHEFRDPVANVELYRVRAELAAVRSLRSSHASLADSRARHGRALLEEANRRFPRPPHLLAPPRSVGVYGHRPYGKWMFAEARVSLALGDRVGLSRAQEAFSHVWAAEPTYPHGARSFARIMAAGARRLGTEPMPLVPPDPATGWSSLAPPPQALPDSPTVRT